MPYAQTSTALGALSSVAAGSWVAIPRGANPSPAGPVVIIACTSVTSGGTVNIEGRNRTSIGSGAGGPTTPTKVLHTAVVAANGNVVVPLKDLLDNGVLPDEVRINVTARTDGTYTGAVLTAS